MKINLRAIVLISLLSTSSIFAQATKPVKTNVTCKDVLQMALDFNLRTMPGAYKESGKHDPKWDKEAIEFLESMSHRFAQAQVSDWYYTGDYPVEKMLELGEKAVALGCDDPLVVYCYGMMLKDNKRKEEYLEVMQRNFPKLVASKYPAFRKLFAADHVLDDFDAKTINPNLQMQAEAVLLQSFGETVRMKFAKPIERRYLYAILSPLVHDSAPELRKKLMEQIKDDPKADPWLLAALDGVNEVKLAWDSRGGGWGNTVTEEGWKGFHDHLNLAHKTLIKAYNLQPDYPEAACEMISVAMGDGDAVGETIDDWFKRSTSAQIDYYPAWSAYTTAILPRWSGSHLEMYRFGCQAMNTNRYDTNVPFYLIDVLQRIANDREGDYRFFRSPGMWANIQRVFDGYINKSKLKKDNNWLKSYLAAFAFRCGEYATAQKYIDELKDQFYSSAFERLKIDPYDSFHICKAIANDPTNNIKEAYESEMGLDYAEAMSSYQRALTPLKKDDPLYSILLRHFLVSRTMMNYVQGDVATLPLESESDLSVWISRNKKKWKIEDKTLIFDKLGDEDELGFSEKFTTNAKIHLEWMWTGDEKKLVVGLMFQNITDPAEYLSVLMYPDRGATRVGNMKWNLKPPLQNQPLELAKDVWHTVDVDHNHDKITVTVDGKLIVSDFQNNWLRNGTSILGFYVKTADPSYTVKFKNLTIQQIGPKQ